MVKRFCCICCTYSDESNFYYAKENVDGLSYQCKPCLREYMRDLNKKKGYFKKYYYKKKGVAYPLPPPIPTIQEEKVVLVKPSYNVSFN